MSDFNYTGIDARGKTKSGQVSAKDKRSARTHIQKLGISVLTLTSASTNGQENISKSPKKGLSLKGKILTPTSKFGSKGEKIGLEFLKRLLELHGSGMPVADAVRLLNQRLSDPQQRALAGLLWRELSEGRTLSRAMREQKAYFSESSTFVIEAGEATGNLAPILKKIVSHLEEKREIKSKVIGGMTYPIFVCLVALGVVLFFLFFLLPQIEEMLASLGGELNFMARMLIDGSNFVLLVGPFIVGIMLLGLGIIVQWSKSENGGQKLDRGMLNIPLFGKILSLSELFQLSSLLATLMWSGIGLTENLRLCEKTIKNRFLRNSFRSARVMVNEGKSLPEALRKFNLMPLMQLDVIEVGERTGNLGNSMDDVSKTFRNQLTKRIKSMTTLVSGLALGFAFSLVALVAISIVTSIFQVSKSISL